MNGMKKKVMVSAVLLSLILIPAYSSATVYSHHNLSEGEYAVGVQNPDISSIKFADIHLTAVHRGACPGILPNLQNEQNAIRDLINQNTNHIPYPTTNWNTNQINQNSLRPTFVSTFHWMGHCRRRNTWPLGSRPFLEIWPVNTNRPKGRCPLSWCNRGYDRYFGSDVPSNINHIDFVFLNTCNSATSGSWYYASLFDGFIDNGARCIMGWTGLIHDDHAFEFSVLFYTYLTTTVYTIIYARNMAYGQLNNPLSYPQVRGHNHNPYR